ncbi:MAG: hypothetical protein AAFW73_26900, partial [Bacteroidota bacterium]
MESKVTFHFDLDQCASSHLQRPSLPLSVPIAITMGSSASKPVDTTAVSPPHVTVHEPADLVNTLFPVPGRLLTSLAFLHHQLQEASAKYEDVARPKPGATAHAVFPSHVDGHALNEAEEILRRHLQEAGAKYGEYDEDLFTVEEFSRRLEEPEASRYKYYDVEKKLPRQPRLSIVLRDDDPRINKRGILGRIKGAASAAAKLSQKLGNGIDRAAEVGTAVVDVVSQGAEVVDNIRRSELEHQQAAAEQDYVDAGSNEVPDDYDDGVDYERDNSGSGGIDIAAPLRAGVGVASTGVGLAGTAGTAIAGGVGGAALGTAGGVAGAAGGAVAPSLPSGYHTPSQPAGPGSWNSVPTGNNLPSFNGGKNDVPTGNNLPSFNGGKNDVISGNSGPGVPRNTNPTLREGPDPSFGVPSDDQGYYNDG